MMTLVRVKGKLTESGQIELELPENWQAGDIIIEVPVLSDEELEELLKSNPKPANEIVTGGWENVDIPDSVEWVEKIRGRK